MKKKKKNLPAEEEPEEAFPDFTEDFYDFLKIPENELFKSDNTDERVKQILIIIAGIMGIGKTALVENIIHRLQEIYGIERVNTVFTKISTEVLLEYGFIGNPEKGWDTKKPIQILIFDDATSVKLGLKDQRRLCSLRHKMMEDTGLKQGIIFSILVTHDWYRLDPNFRRNALITCFLSVSPLDRYSRREYSKFIGISGVTFLTDRLAKSIRFDKEKGIGLIVLPFTPTLGEEEEKIGLIRWSKLKRVHYVEIKELPSGKLVFSIKNKRNKNGD